MALDLPPRRDLPADVKERMRPAFTEARAARSRAPLAVAAGVLLIAGGVAAAQFVIQPATQNVGPGHVRVITPSEQDLARCRTALNDPNWISGQMVVFDLRKVLVGKDGRFCELTRTRARVASETFQPTALEEGSITYRSSKIIAGVPPSGVQTAKARQQAYTQVRPGAFADGVVTQDFFIVETWGENAAFELVFDDRAMPMPRIPAKPATTTDSFESGDTDPWSAENILARCVDISYESSRSADELQDWEPLLVSGLDQHAGMMLAHREHDAWATCAFDADGAKILTPLYTVEDEPDKPFLFTSSETGSDYSLVGRVNQDAKTVEVSNGDGPPVSADIADGHFLAAVPITEGDKPASRDRLHVVVRNAKNEVVYEGGFS